MRFEGTFSEYIDDEGMMIAVLRLWIWFACLDDYRLTLEARIEDRFALVALLDAVESASRVVITTQERIDDSVIKSLRLPPHNLFFVAGERNR